MKRSGTFNHNMKLADVIHTNHLLLPVINRFGIQVGFGEKTIVEICQENNIKTSFFLEILNTFNDRHYVAEQSLNTFSISDLVNYLKKTHQYYIDFVIPDIEKLIDELIAKCNDGSNLMKVIRDFYIGYKTELFAHIKREEEIVFPYVLVIERIGEGIIPDNKDARVINSYSISDFEEEHNNMDDKLMDLKNIIIKYIPCPVDQNLCNTIIDKLCALEGDIKDHSRIEDTILIPCVRELEKKLEM